jgi:hypothetical protein
MLAEAIGVATFAPTNVNASTLAYRPTAAPEPPLGFVPTFGAALSTILIPNPAVPGDDAEFEYEGNAVPPAGFSAFGELYVIEYPLAALVDAAIVDVPKLATPVPIGSGDKLTVAVASVNVNVSATFAFTVMTPAVDAATTPVSIAVVQALSEYVVRRKKNVLFDADGFVTLWNDTVWAPDGFVELAALRTRSLVVAATLDVHPDAAPKLTGCEGNVPAPALENPDAAPDCVHAPLAASQA